MSGTNATCDMSVPLARVLILALALPLALGGETALARPKKQQAERPAVSTMVPYHDGTPIIMQGLEWPKRPARDEDQARARAERPRTIPRGSSTYLAPVPSPSPPALIPLRPSVGTYTPPPIISFSDRATQCNLSFPLNAGLGNNPTNRDFYVRSCVNN
jgi:hypothetical protein